MRKSHPPRPKQKKRKVKRVRKVKQLRKTRGPSAEKIKLKIRWMNALQALVGDKEIKWSLAAMYYDQGMPVQLAFQKLIIKENKELMTFKDFQVIEVKENEDERKRKYEEELLKGPQHWWDSWEYSDYKKLLKKKKAEK